MGRAAELGLDHRLVAGDELDPILGAKLRIELEALQSLVVLQNLLEQLVVYAKHDVGIHLDEAAIGVVGEAAFGGTPRQPFDRLVVQAEIEDSVHHTGHRSAGARPHGHEQRILDVPELGAGDLAHDGHGMIDQRLQLVR